MQRHLHQPLCAAWSLGRADPSKRLAERQPAGRRAQGETQTTWLACSPGCVGLADAGSIPATSTKKTKGCLRVARSFLMRLAGREPAGRGARTDTRHELLHVACRESGPRMHAWARPARAIPATSTKKIQVLPSGSPWFLVRLAGREPAGATAGFRLMCLRTSVAAGAGSTCKESRGDGFPPPPPKKSATRG